MMEHSENLFRLGTESAFEVLARAQALSLKGKNIINLGIGQPDFKTADHIVEAAIKALKDGHHGYTPANGILPLREAVSEDLYFRHQARISPENIIIMPGGKPTMFFSILMFGGPNTEIMYPNPGFPIYESVINYSGAKAIPIALEEDLNFSFKAENVLDKISDKTRLIIINSPGNPTGGVIPRQEIEILVAGLENFPKVTILSDEIYSRMLYDGRKHISLLDFPSIRNRLIVLDGWSKTYAMTGWRLGFSVWPDQLLEYATRLCVNNHSCVNAPTQYAGIAALKGPQDVVNNMLKEFEQRRKFIIGALNELPGVYCKEPGGAFYVFPNIIKTGLSSQKAQDDFLEIAGVATIAGTSFGKMGEGFLRFSYANSLENIEEAIDRIKKIVDGK